MLLLIFRVAGEPYAVEAARVVEVVPRVEIRALPHSPEPLAGLLRYLGRMVPVIDLGVLLAATPCPPLLSTRIILVDDRLPARSEGGACLGLIAEHVIDVRRIEDDQLIPSPSIVGRNPYLGEIVSVDGHGDTNLIPLIDVERILTEPLRIALAESAP